MDKLTTLLSQLAEKLGTNVAHLWDVLIRQAYVSATIELLWYLLIIFLCFYALWKLLSPTRTVAEGENKVSLMGIFLKRDPDGGYHILAFFLVIIGSAFIIVLLHDVSSIITRFINPEYWALNQILHKI